MPLGDSVLDSTGAIFHIVAQHTVPENEVVSEVGLFGYQNTVAMPKTPKWEHTVVRLKELWQIIK